MTSAFSRIYNRIHPCKQTERDNVWHGERGRVCPQRDREGEEERGCEEGGLRIEKQTATKRGNEGQEIRKRSCRWEYEG